MARQEATLAKIAELEAKRKKDSADSPIELTASGYTGEGKIDPDNPYAGMSE